MKEIERIINYSFKNNKLLNLALTHSSYSHKNNFNENNERLEFLGDSILGYIIADFLLNHFNENEGKLSKYRASIVSCEYLSKIITNVGLDKFIKTFPDDLKNNETIKGDFFEALLGAIYLDSDLENCKKFIFRILDLSKEKIIQVFNENKDYKTILQEKIQTNHGKIEYILLSSSGEDNNKVFEMQLKINGTEFAVCKALSKQKAENQCAKIALTKLN